MKKEKKQSKERPTPDELIKVVTERYGKEMRNLDAAVKKILKVMGFRAGLETVRDVLVMDVINSKEGTVEGDDFRRAHSKVCATLQSLDFALNDAEAVFSCESESDNDEESEV
jgi:hypothetical protein